MRDGDGYVFIQNPENYEQVTVQPRDILGDQAVLSQAKLGLHAELGWWGGQGATAQRRARSSHTRLARPG
jgi:hypothetical protein